MRRFLSKLLNPRCVYINIYNSISEIPRYFKITNYLNEKQNFIEFNNFKKNKNSFGAVVQKLGCVMSFNRYST